MKESKVNIKKNKKKDGKKRKLIPKGYIPKGLKKPLSYKQFQKELCITIILISLCCITNFLFYFDLSSIPRWYEKDNCTYTNTNRIFDNKFVNVKSIDINIGNGVMSYIENAIMIICNGFTLFFCIDLVVLLIRRDITENYLNI